MMRAWIKEPKWLTSNVTSTPGYLYHGTSDALAEDISKFGLKTFLPSYRDSSRETWADGSMDARAYFTNKAEEVWKFVKGLAGRPVLLRTKATGEFQHENGPLFYLERRLLPREVEILANNNRWYNLFDFYNTLIAESATAEEVHAAAHEAATSHLNDLPEPTEAQKLAGNYKKGRLRLHGMEITIENPKGSERKGVDPDGKEWSVTMPYHYGYFNRTMAVDGDHVDCIIGENPESELAFVVDQVDANTGKYDEPKVILGTLTQKEARALYVSGFSDGKGPKRLGAMTPMHISALKEWKDGDTLKPLSDAVLESAEKMSRGEFFTVAEAREAAQRSPDYWKALILDATSFEDIAGAFNTRWPGLYVINRLTNNSEGDTVKASTDKEGAMKNAVEVTRNNVTVAEFFAAVKAACAKKGMAFDLDRENFENPPHPTNDSYTVRDGIKYARYGKGEPVREYDGADAAAKAETYRVQPCDYQCYILNFDGSMWNEICEFTFDDEKRGHGYYFQASKDAEPAEETGAVPADGLDAKMKEWERSHNRKGAPTLSTSRAIDAMLRSGYKRDEFKVKTEQKNGEYGVTNIYTYDSLKVYQRTEDLLRNGLKVTWYITEGKPSVNALIAPQNEWHSVESHTEWAGKPGTLEVVDVVKSDNREPGSTVTFGPDQMEEARALKDAIQQPKEPTPVVPKNPKTGPQRVAVLRSMAADIPGLQDYLDKMDAVTDKKQLRALDNQKYELIPSLRGSEVKIGGLDLYWTVADLRDIKEREINKRLKDEAQTAKVKVEREKQEKKEREDLQLKRYKDRPELKKVLDLISADFRVQIIESINSRYRLLAKQYFTDGMFNLQKPDPRKASQWEWAAYQRTQQELTPLFDISYRGNGYRLRPDWEAKASQIAKESADYWIAQFENKMAWKLGEVLERKGGGDVSLAGDVVQHAIRLRFPDNSGFDMRTQQVYSTSTKGTPFVRYPTTFHNVIFANGDRMSTPSAEKMQKEFGVTDDKKGE